MDMDVTSHFPGNHVNTKFLFTKIKKSIKLYICWCGSMAEQRYRKPQVGGSIPFTSLFLLFILF